MVVNAFRKHGIDQRDTIYVYKNEKTKSVAQKAKASYKKGGNIDKLLLLQRKRDFFRSVNNSNTTSVSISTVLILKQDDSIEQVHLNIACGKPETALGSLPAEWQRTVLGSLATHIL